MVAHTYNPNTQKTEAEDYCEFKSSLGYVVNPRTA